MSSPLELTEERWKRAFLGAGQGERLAAFRAKIATGEPLVYGAIGGSITEGASAKSPWRRYASRFARWLDAKAPCELVNAGIGASNSLFGSFRVGKDLLAKKPDVVTLEYAVNDIDNPETAESYEALVRQCLVQPQKPLTILLFTMRRNGGNKQAVQAGIGRHYGLPMLSYADALYPEVEKGTLDWSEISPDEVHPNDAGHAFIGELLARLASGAPAPAPAPEPSLPERLHPGSAKYENGRILDASTLEILACEGWAQGPHKGGYAGLQSEKPGSVFEAAFEGSTAIIGFKRFAGPFGRAEASIDGGKPALLEGFYEKPPIQAWAGGHTVLVKLAERLTPGRHTLKVKLLEERHKDSSGSKFDFGYLLAG